MGNIFNKIASILKGESGKVDLGDNHPMLLKPGESIITSTAVITLISYEGKSAIQKVFNNLPESVKAFENEKKAYSVLKKFVWCPKLYSIKDNALIVEYIPNELRLDIVFNKQRKLISKEVYKYILSAIADMYCEGYSHGNICLQNIFVLEEGIKIIDFELLKATDKVIDIFESFDIIGGKEVLLQKNNFLLSDLPGSLKPVFKVDSLKKIKEVLSEIMKEQMLTSSLSFFTKKAGSNARHMLKKQNIYSTFDLRNVKVSAEEGQRNTEKRFAQFKVNGHDIRSKTVLDIGSNIGGTLLGLDKYSPSYMLGLEYDADKVELSNRLAKLNNIKNVEFKTVDVEHDNFLKDFTIQFDVVFCLAVLEHVQKKKELLNKLAELCKNKLFFEGNAGTDVNFVANSLKEAGFKEVEYLGFSNDEKNQRSNTRPLFIATKS